MAWSIRLVGTEHCRFFGCPDEVRLWSVALTAEQIAQIYSLGRAGTER